MLFLDTRPLHALLMQNVVMLEQKIRGQPLSDRTSRRSDQLALMTKLASQVDPEFKPFARRGERTSAAGTVDAIVGFNKISGYLREEEHEPLSQLEPGDSFGGTMELAVFGRMRNERDRRLELARRRLATFAAPGGPWEVKDVSADRLPAARADDRRQRGDARDAGVDPRARPDASGRSASSGGCKRITADRAEIGLQIIANSLVGVDLVEQRRTADRDYSVDGEPTTINGRMFHGLFLTLRKRETEAAVQSLIVPAVEYQPTRRFRLQTTNSSLAIRFGRLLEQQPDWVWATVEPLELPPSARAADAAARR